MRCCLQNTHQHLIAVCILVLAVTLRRPCPPLRGFCPFCQNNEMSGQNSQQGGGAQPQRSGSLSKQASLERKDLCPGLMASGASFSWDYIQPKAGGKDFLGQRKKDVRSSLDWDFQNNVAVAVTRRSKEYGEERPRITTAGLSAGRSYSGSISDSNSLV